MTANSNGDYVIRVNSALFTLAFIAVLLRSVSKWRSGLWFGADDWWIVTSLVPLGALLGVDIWGVDSGGVGQHIWLLTQHEQTVVSKVYYVVPYPYAVCITMVKISILLYYRRIFATRNFHLATLVVGCLCIGWFLADVLSSIFTCHPIEGGWDHTVKATCTNTQASFDGLGIATLLLDIMILCLPVYMVWKLKLPMRRRIQLCAVFLLGSFVCVASLVRVVVVQGLGAGDVTWEMIPATIWSFCEPATAIICACLPAISTMFRRSKQDGSTARTWYGTSSSARRSEKTSSSMARSRGDTLSRIEQPDETDYLARARGPSEGSESLDPEFPMNAIAYDQTRPQARPIVQNLQQPAEEQTQNISQTSTLLEDLEAARGTEPQEVEETRSRPRTPDNRDSWAFDVLNVI